MEMLPIGTVVLLKGAINKLLIIGRAIEDEDGVYHDYISVVYPEGYSAEKLFIFDNEDIAEVIQKGFSDHEETEYMEYLNRELGR
jgi:hypothetical protein